MQKSRAPVAILATGDELVQGDILNTNAQHMVRAMQTASIHPGMQLVVADEQSQLVDALRYLLSHHQVVITIGGLGPTLDDLTRNAVAEALNVPLVFDDTCWQALQLFLQQYRVPVPLNNKQQCWFPKGAEIILNPCGSANACIVTHKAGIVVMLPGPPRECLPLFDEVVLPFLKSLNIARQQHQQRWLLMGVGESSVAEDLQQHFAESTIDIGYRAHYPYLDVKFFTQNPTELEEAVAVFEMKYAEYIVSRNEVTASQQLLHYLLETEMTLKIVDRVTHGLLMHTLSRPPLLSRLVWGELAAASKQGDVDFTVTVDGFELFWQGADAKQDTVTLTMVGHDDGVNQQRCFRFHGQLTLSGVVEWVCWCCFLYLSSS